MMHDGSESNQLGLAEISVGNIKKAGPCRKPAVLASAKLLLFVDLVP
jgi:hypothetical protein